MSSAKDTDEMKAKVVQYFKKVTLDQEKNGSSNFIPDPRIAALTNSDSLFILYFLSYTPLILQELHEITQKKESVLFTHLEELKVIGIVKEKVVKEKDKSSNLHYSLAGDTTYKLRDITEKFFFMEEEEKLQAMELEPRDDFLRQLRAVYKDSTNQAIVRGRVALFTLLTHPKKSIALWVSVFGTFSVSEYQTILQVSQQLVSKHLKSLEKLHFLQSHKEGKRVYYVLRDPSVKAILVAIMQRVSFLKKIHTTAKELIDLK